MTHIVGLRLTNFYRYRGLTELELEAKAYAIIAEREGEPERSNWCGKTSLTIAIRFALFGWHTKRTEDEWITDGEKDGGVDLELSDGTFISRTRTRGKSTQLRVVREDISGGEHEAHGVDAQEVLDRLLGFSDEDAAATWWIGQGKMARLVSMQGEKLTEIVNGWLALDPLDVAADHVGKKLRELTNTMQQTQGKLEVVRQRRDANQSLAAARPDLADAVVILEGKVHRLGGDQAIQTYNEWTRDEDDHQRWLSLTRERTCESKFDPPPDPKQMDAAGERVAQLRSKTDAADQNRQAKRRLASGQFDGTCPVGGIQCPAKDQLNSRAAENKRMLDGAEKQFRELDNERAQASIAHRTLTEKKNAADLAARTVASIDKRLAEVADGYARFLATKEPPNPIEVQQAMLELERARAAVRVHDQAVEAAKGDADLVTVLEAQLKDHQQAVQARREALQIFGRNGAPRRIAEATLGQVEARTNAALQRCGIDLSVTIRWAREGKVLSKACYSCGAAFPASQKVKACAECGAERGPQLDEKLAIECSDDSGGALDLAGALFQLSVGRWLRERRGYGWAVAVLDEPLGQLDPFNRRAFATKLAGALQSEFALEQAFVVAHDTSTLDAMPGRIRVIAGPDGSRAVVE